MLQATHSAANAWRRATLVKPGADKTTRKMIRGMYAIRRMGGARAEFVGLRAGDLPEFIRSATQGPQPQGPQPQAEAGPQLETVVVTGSRIPRLTSLDVGPAPVVTITSADILQKGFTDMSDVMRNLNQNLGSLDNNTAPTVSPPALRRSTCAEWVQTIRWCW